MFLRIFLIFTLASASAFAGETGERVALEKVRYEQTYSRAKDDAARAQTRAGLKRVTRIVPHFRPSKAAVEADTYSALEINYPNAWARYKTLEDFSYFGFKKYDVEQGRLSLEEFLKEYEAFLNK